jgi:hypothetical protein
MFIIGLEVFLDVFSGRSAFWAPAMDKHLQCHHCWAHKFAEIFIKWMLVWTFDTTLA